MPEVLIPQCVLLPSEVPPARIPTVAPVLSAEQLAGTIQHSLDEYLMLTPGERVLLIEEGASSGLVSEAFQEELRRRGNPLEVLKVWHQKVPQDDRLQVARILQGSHLDRNALERIRQNTAVILLPCSDPSSWIVDDRPMEKYLEGIETRVLAVIPSPEILVSPWARFPRTLHQAILEKVLTDLNSSPTLIFTSGQGASLISNFRAQRPTSKLVYFPPASVVELILEGDGQPDADGILVYSRLFSLPIPTIRMDVERSRVLSLDGAGSVTRLLTDQWTESGRGNLSRIRLGLNPKAFPYCPEGSLFPDWGCLAGVSRSGMSDFVFHTQGVQGDSGPWHFQVLFTNLNVGGSALIAERGHLLALDDTEVRSVAGEEADSLLTEEWVPALRP